MSFETKIKIVLAEDLEPWQELNVTAFLMSGISGTQNIIGETYVDGENNKYLSMSKQPIMIHSAPATELNELVKKSFSKEVVVSIYTKELFETYNDEDNRAEIKKHALADLNLVGVAMYGKKNHVDKLFKGFKFHK